MVDWNFLIDEAAIASVLPNEYARFAMPVRDALGVFLAGLPESRQQMVLADQAALPASASVSQRLSRLAASCPVLHKLGQVLARDQHVAAELRHELQKLESLPPSVDEATLLGAITEELGPLDQVGVEIDFPALAEASVAVVVGYRHAEQRGVLKVLKPGIEQRLDEELALAEQVGAHLDQRCEELGIPHLNYQDTFEQVRDKLRWEVRLDQEQQHLAQAAVFYADDPAIHIPALMPHCTHRITAMQRVDGVKVTERESASLADKDRLAALVATALVAKPVFSRDSAALFHCDPHAGNLFVTHDGRLAILDWSLTGTLTETERVAIVQVMLGAITLQPKRIVEVLSNLAERPPDQPVLLDVAERWVRRIRQGQVPGFSWLVGMLDDAVQTAGLRAGADLMLFRKSLHSIDGVMRDLGADASRMDCVLLEQFLRHLVKEWPRRWYSGPLTRDFATRLSNLDVAGWMMELPHTVSRFWLGHVQDWLSSTRSPSRGGR